LAVTQGRQQESLSAAPPISAEDAAWASINTPLTVTELAEFCQDTERLYRINPLLEFDEWSEAADGCFRFRGRNLSNQQSMVLELCVEKLADGLCVKYSDGLKISTLFRIEPAPQGSKLTLIDQYAVLSEGERQARLDEVDKSLIPWANYLQEYILSWKRWSWLAPWRWYMRRVWQPMKPSARRITYMIVWITVAEIIAFLMIIAIFWLEVDKYLGRL